MAARNLNLRPIMTSPIEKYVQARKALREAQQKLDTYRDIIKNVSDALQHTPSNFLFANCGSMPAQLSMSPRARTEDANRWPSASEIQDVLRNWHAARDEVETTFDSIPTEDREGLERPPFP